MKRSPKHTGIRLLLWSGLALILAGSIFTMQLSPLLRAQTTQTNNHTHPCYKFPHPKNHPTGTIITFADRTLQTIDSYTKLDADKWLFVFNGERHILSDAVLDSMIENHIKSNLKDHVCEVSFNKVQPTNRPQPLQPSSPSSKPAVQAAKKSTASNPAPPAPVKAKTTAFGPPCTKDLDPYKVPPGTVLTFINRTDDITSRWTKVGVDKWMFDKEEKLETSELVEMWITNHIKGFSMYKECYVAPPSTVKKLCYLCEYQQVDGCGNQTSKDTCSATKDCTWVAPSGGTAHCMNRFQYGCEKRVATRKTINTLLPQNTKFDVIMAAPLHTGKSLPAEISGCSGIQNDYYGHSNEQYCNEPFQTAALCLTKSPSCKNLVMINDGCSTFKDQKAVDAWAKWFQKQITPGVTVTFSANQTVASSVCSTKMDIILTCDTMQVTYAKCHKIGPYISDRCHETGEVAKCTDEKNNVATEICCPKMVYSQVYGWSPGFLRGSTCPPSGAPKKK